MKMTYSFDDIGLIPRECSTVKSRHDVSLETSIRMKTKLKIPIVASPMDTVCNGVMAAEMDKLGGVGIIHRFQTIDDQLRELLLAEKTIKAYRKTNDEVGIENNTVINIGVAVGVSGDYKKRLNALLKHYNMPKNNCDYKLWICFDTANGFTSQMRDAIEYLKTVTLNDVMGTDHDGKLLMYDPQNMIIVAGNIASVEGYRFLNELGVDIVRVGIGGGSACSTSDATGVGAGIISILEEIEKYKSNGILNSLIMIDGGIRSSGDIVKSFAMGADLVMLGRMLSGFDESPGDIVNEKGKEIKIRFIGIRIGGGKVYEYNGKEVHEDELNKIKNYKKFRGLASPSVTDISNKLNGKSTYTAPEGIETYVEYKGSLEPYMNDLTFGIKSALSYFNSIDLTGFKNYFYAYPDSVVLLSQNAIIERKPKYHGEFTNI